MRTVTDVSPRPELGARDEVPTSAAYLLVIPVSANDPRVGGQRPAPAPYWQLFYAWLKAWPGGSPAVGARPRDANHPRKSRRIRRESTGPASTSGTIPG